MSIREYITRLKHQKDFTNYIWLLIVLPSESFRNSLEEMNMAATFIKQVIP